MKRLAGQDPANWTRTGRCRQCRLPQTKEGHDPCLGTLPGVSFACCGHGRTEGYIMFDNGRIMRGLFEPAGSRYLHPIAITIRRWLRRQKQ